jgi:uncharacterized membrane protein YidH (DUF202 family)
MVQGSRFAHATNACRFSAKMVLAAIIMMVSGAAAMIAGVRWWTSPEQMTELAQGRYGSMAPELIGAIRLVIGVILFAGGLSILI